MVAQEGEPAFRKQRISRCFAHPAGDRSLGDIKSEHEKFTMNPGCSPGQIFGDHFEDKIANLPSRFDVCHRVVAKFGTEDASTAQIRIGATEQRFRDGRG